MSECKTVTAVFKDRASAERACSELACKGYHGHDFNVAMSERARDEQFLHPGMIGPADHLGEDRPASSTGEDDDATLAAEGAGIGGALGGAVGAVVAGVAALGTALALPGVGLVIAGPLAAAIAGAGAGAATGGLVGALVGWGIPEEHVEPVEQGLGEGGVLVSVEARSEADMWHIAELWRSHDAKHVSH